MNDSTFLDHTFQFANINLCHVNSVNFDIKYCSKIQGIITVYLKIGQISTLMIVVTFDSGFYFAILSLCFDKLLGMEQKCSGVLFGYLAVGLDPSYLLPKHCENFLPRLRIVNEPLMPLNAEQILYCVILSLRDSYYNIQHFHFNFMHYSS